MSLDIIESVNNKLSYYLSCKKYLLYLFILAVRGVRKFFLVHGVGLVTLVRVLAGLPVVASGDVHIQIWGVKFVKIDKMFLENVLEIVCSVSDSADFPTPAPTSSECPKTLGRISANFVTN